MDGEKGVMIFLFTFGSSTQTHKKSKDSVAMEIASNDKFVEYLIRVISREKDIESGNEKDSSIQNVQNILALNFSTLCLGLLSRLYDSASSKQIIEDKLQSISPALLGTLKKKRPASTFHYSDFISSLDDRRSAEYTAACFGIASLAALLGYTYSNLRWKRIFRIHDRLIAIDHIPPKIEQKVNKIFFILFLFNMTAALDHNLLFYHFYHYY